MEKLNVNGTDETWRDLLSCLEDIRRMAGDERSDRVRELPGLAANLALYSDTLAEKQELVHYTSWDRAMAILRNKNPVMRMYHYELANDPEEGQILPSPWKAIYKEANACIRRWRKASHLGVTSTIDGGDAYGCSFSSNGRGVEDKLTFWRFYGNDGEGCSFRVSRSIFFSREYRGIYQVRYRHSNGTAVDDEGKAEDQMVAQRMRQLLGSTKDIVDSATESDDVSTCRVAIESLCRVLGGYRHLIKNARYSDEREWRMVRVMPPKVKFDLDHSNLVRRYVDGLPWRTLLSSGSVVTVGPRVRNRVAALAYVKRLVDEKRKFTGSDVKASVQRYRRSDR